MYFDDMVEECFSYIWRFSLSSQGYQVYHLREAANHYQYGMEAKHCRQVCQEVHSNVPPRNRSHWDRLEQSAHYSVVHLSPLTGVTLIYITSDLLFHLGEPVALTQPVESPLDAKVASVVMVLRNELLHQRIWHHNSISSHSHAVQQVILQMIVGVRPHSLLPQGLELFISHLQWTQLRSQIHHRR